jgi:D-threonate/D-erythronate kinase
MVKIAIIADDLTGALDTASPFAVCGLRTATFTSVQSLEAQAPPPADVISVSTESRHLPSDAAAKAARHAALAMHGMAPDIVLKKIDSRLKGNILAEVEAIADVFGRSSLIVAPASPDVGRFVIGESVCGSGVIGNLPIRPLFEPSEMKVEIPDVAVGADLVSIARRLPAAGEALAVCARGLAVALAGCLSSQQGQLFQLVPPVMLGIGSRDPVTLEQVDALAGLPGCTVLTAPDGDVPETIPVAPFMVIKATGPGTTPADQVAKRFATGLARAIHIAKPRTVLLSGGDTAAALLREIGCQMLMVGGEAAPGLAWAELTFNANPLRLIAKSGGFGDKQTLLRLFRHGWKHD